ncbi:protein kinase domain-containing protein [Actinoplanes couchii]|uniref:Non-specific serine/threonine protein kinase n=1 Tax=Actinoplanes couchii TaxID=403638 RepID=A0ABQ3XEG2_9ACTN|nr:discoidin domain-containing protein [Actinoplanes couchii]MDR6319739.1 serine/threonine protein kinase [Actinoplanes couchii]GID56873.1 hypothetical protein Aco03nite_052770 [Actinoplanes couchii]
MDTAFRVNPLSDADPEKIGAYQLLGRLGTGGMAVVYLAEDPDGTPVAVKLIHPALAADAEFSGRFRGEVERARQVPSFCTAEFLDADLDHDPPYLVVEYVDGPTLTEVVEERGPLRGGALHSLAVGVATALTGIHGAGVIHRDLKPDNVLLPPGSPKVIDFGISQPLVATSQFTRADVLVGTVAYMAPERFADDRRDAPVTPAADVFAWACVIAYAGTGRTPFGGDSLPVTVARIMSRQPDLDGLPDPLRAILRLALSKQPADRPTAADLLAMLVGEMPVPQGAEPAGEKPAPARARWPIFVPAGFLSAAGLIAVVMVANYGDTVIDVPRAAPPASVGSPAPVSGVDAGPSPSVMPSPGRSSRRSQPPAPVEVPSAGPAVSRSSASPSRSKVRGTANPTGRNLALGRPATASSSESPPFVADSAVDGNPETRWSSTFSDPQWLSVDLGGTYRISEVELWWEVAYATDYRIEVSLDGVDWTTVRSITGGTGGNVTVLMGGVPGRFVRMFGTKRAVEYGYSLFEMEVR